MQAKKLYGQYKAIDAQGKTVAMCPALKHLKAIIENHNANNPNNLYRIFTNTDYKELQEKVKNDLAFNHI